MSEQSNATPANAITRRRLLAACSAAGVGQTVFPGALLALAVGSEGTAEAQLGGGAQDHFPGPKITSKMIDDAAAIAGITIADDQKALMLDGLNNQRDDAFEIRKLALPNSVAPAFVFDPVPGTMVLDTVKKPMKISAAPKVSFEASGDVEALAFLSVRELAELVRAKRVTSTALTKMYIARLKRYDPVLHCVITLTEERA